MEEKTPFVGVVERNPAWYQSLTGRDGSGSPMEDGCRLVETWSHGSRGNRWDGMVRLLDITPDYY